jgi:hypothetical protein
MASHPAHSTSWGSLVRAQYRPPQKTPLGRVSYLQAKQRRASRRAHVSAKSAGFPEGTEPCPLDPGKEIVPVHRLSNSSFPARSLDHATEGASRCLLLRPCSSFQCVPLTIQRPGGYGRGSNAEGVGLPSNRPTEVAAAQKALAGLGSLEALGLGADQVCGGVSRSGRASYGWRIRESHRPCIYGRAALMGAGTEDRHGVDFPGWDARNRSGGVR